jgi:hypothetical protein
MNTYHAAFWSSDPSRLSSSDEEEDDRDTGYQITTGLTRPISNTNIKFKAIGALPKQLTGKANSTDSALCFLKVTENEHRLAAALQGILSMVLTSAITVNSHCILIVFICIFYEYIFLRGAPAPSAPLIPMAMPPMSSLKIWQYIQPASGFSKEYPCI